MSSPATAAVRAVIDMSSLVKGDLRADLQQNARIGAFTAIWSPWITAELVRVLTWKWIERDLDVSTANWRRCSISYAYEGIEYIRGQDFLDRLAEGVA
ncbi:MAG: hypothetical protein ACRDIE_23830 [Chloroflexota bacterium]